MGVWLGNADYSPIKGFAELQGDFATINSSITFTEGRVVNVDDNYIFCLIATSITDLSKADSFKPGTPVCVTIHSKDYTRWTKDNPKLPVQPTDLEQTVIQWLEGKGSQWLEAPFKGKLHLNGSSNILAAIKDKQFWTMLAEFEQCEADLTKNIETKSNGSSGKKSYNPGQTEAQKLAERVTAIITQSGAYGTDITDLSELSLSLSEFKKQAPEAFEIFITLLKLVTIGK